MSRTRTLVAASSTHSDTWGFASVLAGTAKSRILKFKAVSQAG